MRTRIGLLALAILSLMGDVCPALAQGASPGLFRGLFGGAEPVAARRQSLDLTGSAYAAYLKDVEIEEDEFRDLWGPGASASLRYQWGWKQGSVGAYLAGGSTYVEDRKEFEESPWVNRWNAGARASYSRRLAQRISLGANASVDYTPNYRFGFGGFGAGFGTGFGPGVFESGFSLGPDRFETVSGLDDSVASQGVLTTTGNVSLSRSITSRSSLNGAYRIQQSKFLGDDDVFSDQLSQMISVGYSYRINQYVGARAGYGLRRTQYEDGTPSTSHDINVGIDGGYGREFEIAKRTTFSFDTRSNVFVGEELSGDETFDPSTQLFIGGFVALAHRWGRTWQAQIQYNRSAGFTDTFTDPVFSNTVSASVRGVPVRRVDFMASAVRSLGEIGFSDNENGYSTTTGVVQIRVAISRYVAGFAQYYAYYYDFDSRVVLPGNIPRQRDRQGGAVGISVWLPLL